MWPGQGHKTSWRKLFEQREIKVQKSLKARVSLGCPRQREGWSCQRGPSQEDEHRGAPGQEKRARLSGLEVTWWWGHGASCERDCDEKLPSRRKTI